MCEPTTIMAIAAGAQFALDTGSQVVQAAEQANNAEAVGEEANRSARRSYRDLQARRIEEQKSAALEAEEAARAGRKAVATARVSAGDAGVGGASVIATQTDLAGQEGRALFAIERNLQITQDQLTRQGEGLYFQARARVNEAKATVPSLAALGLKIASSAVSGASNTYGQTQTMA